MTAIKNIYKLTQRIHLQDIGPFISPNKMITTAH